MKCKALTRRVLSLLLFAVSTCALAQERRSAHFTGLINDYTPLYVKGGPYEMHGQCAMDIHQERGTADFTADMTMSDYGMTPTGTPDATQGGQNAHTHHIELTRVRLIWDMVGCPTYSPPTTHRFQVRGTVSLITGNGGPAPFEPTPPVSTLQVCVTGGAELAYSNLIHGIRRPSNDTFRTASNSWRRTKSGRGPSIGTLRGG